MNKNAVRLTESQLHRVIKESVHKILSEINLGNGQVDFDDLHISSVRENCDGYYEFEAQCDNNWYTLRGTYHGNGNIELDELISGHSGHGRQVPITSQIESWFEMYGNEILSNEIERRIADGRVETPNYDDEY